jgi:L,D-transpeptidase catalytic domain
LNTERARSGSASSQQVRRILLGSVCVLVFGAAMALSSGPAAAKIKQKSDGKQTERLSKQAERQSKQPFGEIPKGPLQIFVSINEQKLHFYSGGVHVADEPVATGMPGHPTPMGVFSVIERDRNHHSNIYDNAPMPFMERITWSGVALHEGVGLGHPASHGCIRMPHDFAARLWLLPTMGMRVIVARPELRPVDFADPHLFVHKQKPSMPAAALRRSTETAQVIDAGTRTDVLDPPTSGLRTTLSQDPPAAKPGSAAIDGAPAATNDPPAAAGTPAASASAAAPIAVSARAAAATPAANENAESTKPLERSFADIVKAAAADAMGSAATTIDANAPQAVEPVKAVVTDSAAPALAAETTPAAPSAPAATPTEPAKAAATPNAAPNTSTLAQPAPTDAANAATAPADIAAPSGLDDVPLPLSKPANVSGRGPIAIFVSRQESKIYVRQDFTPLFEAPIKIENPRQPFGTIVFTAMDYLPDHSAFRWTVVTLPGEAQKVERWKYVEDAKGRRKREAVEERVADTAQGQQPPETPQEALARIEIAPDVAEQISELIVPGSSLIISDHGLGPETGEGTDFIVITR